MTTAFTFTQVDAANAEIGRLRAQVERLQRFAFRDLIDATDEQLAAAFAGLSESDREVLRIVFSGNTPDRMLPEQPEEALPEPAAEADQTPRLMEEAGAVRDAWRRSVGLLPPLPVTAQAASEPAVTVLTVKDLPVTAVAR